MDEKQAEWWRSYEARGVIVPGLIEYAALEYRASAIRHVSTLLVPGLFQTEQYTEAVLRLLPTSHAPTADQDRTLARFRLDRQWHVFERQSPPKVEAIIDEAALLRRVGDRQVMYDQIVHLRKLAGLPHITLQILPLNTPFSYVSLVGAASAALLSFANKAERDVLSVEEPLGPAYNSINLYEIQLFAMEFAALQQQALSVARTRTYLDDLAKRMLAGGQPDA